MQSWSTSNFLSQNIGFRKGKAAGSREPLKLPNSALTQADEFYDIKQVIEKNLSKKGILFDGLQK